MENRRNTVEEIDPIEILFGRATLRSAARDVGAGVWICAHPDENDGVQRAVQSLSHIDCNDDTDPVSQPGQPSSTLTGSPLRLTRGSLSVGPGRSTSSADLSLRSSL